MLLKILYLGLLFSSVAALRRRELLQSYLETNEVQTESCDRVMERVYDDHVIATNPPDLVGDWTSGSCEVRPGAEFLLRKYTFFDDKHQFELNQYYYSDSDCTIPSYSVVAKGRLFTGEPSWLVPGALDSEYALSLVSVMPYTTEAVANLATQLNRTCPKSFGRMEGKMEPSKIYSIYHFMARDELDGDSDVLVDKDCMAALDLAFHELQLLRLEVRKKKLEIRRSLFLGDIHTDKKERPHYKPTSYQEPLYYQGTSGCSTCQRIASATRSHPPILFRRQATTEPLTGEWFSTRCEVRPVGQFVTRHLIFDDSGLWEGYYHHFADQRCRQPMFTVYVTGSYGAKEKSKIIYNADYYRIKITHMKITPKDDRIVNLLNGNLGEDVCAKQGSWKLGETQDVTSTNGCAMLSLRLPINEKELMKLEKVHHHTLLFVGQLPSNTDSSSQTSSSNSEWEQQQPSTSFQSALIKCGTSADVAGIVKKHNAMLDINNMAQVAGQSSGVSKPAIASSLLLLLIALPLVIVL